MSQKNLEKTVRIPLPKPLMRDRVLGLLLEVQKQGNYYIESNGGYKLIIDNGEIVFESSKVEGIITEKKSSAYAHFEFTKDNGRSDGRFDAINFSPLENGDDKRFYLEIENYLKMVFGVIS